MARHPLNVFLKQKEDQHEARRSPFIEKAIERLTSSEKSDGHTQEFYSRYLEKEAFAAAE